MPVANPVLDWLVEPGCPSLSYRTLTELLGVDPAATEAREAKAGIPDSAEALYILDRMRPGGYWLQLKPSTGDAKKPVFDTKISKRGKIRVITKGHEGLSVTVIVRAYPKIDSIDKYKRGTWRKSWTLR